ncbi:hypothetical protein [Paludisphaera rhizosphaerae]|uniref:hypothetical protein n=1 Tax=Paludisphaera rhizosphaerae TaxID=2711216 RepID=UPI0013EACC77|nr:hypothetical protein [Paludisphaera rhizosphaerae]
MARETPGRDPWIDSPNLLGMCGGRLLGLLAVALLAGCSGRGTYITGGPSQGQLKSSLSHLEYENDQLKTQVARLKEENRTFEERLVQEQLHNGEITAKLDNARNLLRDGGNPDSDLDAPLAGARTLPAGRSSSTRRKAPAAQISQVKESDEIPPIRIDDAPRGSRSSSTRSKTARPQDDSLGFNEDDLRWTPIARDDKSAAPKR